MRIAGRTPQEYVQLKKDEILARNKAYYELHKDKVRVYNQQYRDKHKEELKKYEEGRRESRLEYTSEYNKNYRTRCKHILLAKFDCSCGGKYSTKDKSTHFKTKMHLKWLEENNTTENEINI
jgi:hypothetical protein